MAYTNSTSVTDGGSPPPPYTLGTGDSLTNTSTGTITVNTGANVVNVVGQPASFINNSGLIQFHTVGGGAAINVVSAGSVGTITNAGTISVTPGSGNAIDIAGSVSSLVNSGLITASSGDAVTVSGTLGSLVNQGVISAPGLLAAAVRNSGGVIGSISNSGTMSADGRSGGVIANTSGSIGSISNTGLIHATGAISTGIGNGGTIGSISNAGTILANSGTGISNQGTITGGITNAASGLISGAIAIDNAAGAKLTINNAGQMVGAVNLGAHGDTLNITGGSINGAIVGQTGSGDTVNFNVAAPYTTGGAIQNVDTLSVNAGLVNVDNPVSGATLFAIQQGATAALGASVATAQFINSGLLNVGTNTATITGNYTQGATGQLGFTINNTTNGRLNVTGTALITGAANAIVANVQTSNTLIGQTLTVVSAGTLSVTNASSLTVADNNPLIVFNPTLVGNDLLLTAAAPTAPEANQEAGTLVSSGLSAAQGAGLTGIGYTNAVSIGAALQSLLAQQILQGNPTLFNMLSNLSSAGWAQVYASLTPQFIARAQVALSTIQSGGGQWVDAINQRFELARNDTDTGMAAGDATGRGISAWVQPFGALGSQDTESGVAGYRSSVYGVALGGDMAVTPSFRLGAALQLGQTDIRYKDMLSGDSSSIFTVMVSAYGIYRFENKFFLDGMISLGHNSYDGSTTVGPLGTGLSSSFGGFQFMSRIGLGYDYDYGKFRITPQVSLQNYYFNIDSYTTSGGAALGIDEHINGQSLSITQPRIGSRFSYRYETPSGLVAIPEIHLYYMHNFGTANQSTTGYFVGGTQSFSVTTPTFARDIVNIGAGVTLMRKGPFDLSAVYDYTGGANARQNSFFIRFRTDF